MSKLLGFIDTFCCSAVAFGVLYMLVPENKLQKAVKYCFCLCFLAAVIGSMGFKSMEFKEYQSSIADIQNAKTETAAELVFKRALADAGISFSDVTVITSKRADGGIDIIEVAVTTTEDPQKVKETLSNGDYYKVSVNGE